jgi:predicted RNase H-like HicB family nuclease
MKIRELINILQGDGWYQVRMRAVEHSQAVWVKITGTGTITMKYTVIIEKGETDYGAHVPDLPGCVAVADSREQVLDDIKQAIELHIRELRAAGEPVPPPSSASAVIDIDAA